MVRDNKYNPNFHSGLFRHRISIVEMVDVPDDYNNQVQKEHEIKKAWAMIKTLKGSEYLRAAAVRAERIYRFIIHYTPGITNKMIVKYDSRTFDIIEPPINDDEMNRTLTIIAKERL